MQKIFLYKYKDHFRIRNYLLITDKSKYNNKKIYLLKQIIFSRTFLAFKL